MSKFQPGQSGNPGGKAKKTVHCVINGAEGDYTEFEIFSPAVGRAAKVYFDILNDDEAPRAALLKAAEYVTNRVFGKPRQALEISGEGGGPIETRNNVADLSKLSVEELRQLEAIHAKLADSGTS